MRSVPVLSLICASGLLLGNVVQAQESVSYNYAELSYVRSNVDLGSALGDIDGDGGRFGFSFDILDNFYAVGSYETIDLDDTPLVTALDVDSWRGGFGWHSNISNSGGDTFKSARDRWSLFAQAEYVSFDVDGSSTVDGYAAKVGVRGINHTEFEFIGAVGYEELENSDGEITFEGRLTYDITDDFEVQFGFDYVKDFVRGFIGVRYHFPGFIN